MEIPVCGDIQCVPRAALRRIFLRITAMMMGRYRRYLSQESRVDGQAFVVRGRLHPADEARLRTRVKVKYIGWKPYWEPFGDRRSRLKLSASRVVGRFRRAGREALCIFDHI